MEEHIKYNIEQFFEYEKNDTLEEFIINFKPFIKQFQKREVVCLDLIKRFKIRKQELIKETSDTPEQYKVGHGISIKNNEHIIKYLKKQLDFENKIELKKDYTLKEEHQNFESSKKTYKKEKQKLVFSEEVLLYIDKLNNGETLNLTSKDMINSVIKYYYAEKSKKINLKNQLQKLGKSEELNDTYLQIKKINKILDDLIRQKNKLLQQKKENEKRKKSEPFKLPVSYDQIKIIDKFFKIDTVQIIERITKNEEDKKEILNYIDQLLMIYKNMFTLEKSRNNQHLNEKRQLNKKYKNKDEQVKVLIENYDLLIKETNVHMNILNNLLNYLKHYKNNNAKNKSCNGEFLEEFKINEHQEEVKNNIEQGYDIASYQLKDIMYGFGNFIKYGNLNIETLQYAKQIINSINFEEINKDEIIEGIFYVLDTVKYRLSNTPKQEKKVRKILKEVRIIFDYILKNCKENNKQTTHDYLFDLVNYFLNDETDFLYLKKLVNQIPKIVNTRYINKENNLNEHIVIYIVNKFIDNYRKMLKDRNSDYINKDYLKSVYLLFTKSYHVYLTEEEKIKIDRLLSNFMKEVNNSITSSKRKQAVKNDLRDMYTSKYYEDKKLNIVKEIDEYKLEWQINSITSFLNRSIKDTKRVDLLEEDVARLESNYCAYSIQKKDQQTILKFHVIDLYDFIFSHSEIDKHIFNETLNKGKIDSIIMNQIHMIKNGTYPTITYEITFDEKGNYKDSNEKFLNFTFYKSKINVKQCYGDYNLFYSIGDILLQEFKNLYRISLIKNHRNYNNNFLLSDIENYFENILNQAIMEYFKSNRFPFIYSGIKKPNDHKKIGIMNQVSHILSKIDKKDFEIIHQVLCCNVDEFHYSIEPFEGEYQLPIKNPVNYPGLIIQRILHELVIDNKNNECEYDRQLKKYENQCEEVVASLNYFNNYIDEDVLAANKGKLIKVKRILF